MQKTILYSVVLVLLWYLPCNQLQAQAGNSDKVYVVADTQATFYAGDNDIRNYFMDALSEAFEKFERFEKLGTANVTMIITRSGEVKDPVITFSHLTPAMDAVILKAAKEMPPWKPAKVGVKPVNFRVTFSINVTDYQIPGLAAYDGVEEMPHLPGGYDELTKFIYANLKYPEAEIQNNIRGTEYVQFIVNTRGELKDIKFLKSLGKNFEMEVRRVLSLMPRWIPGRQNGRFVPVRFNLPVRFNPPPK